jgi:hypothetical protein
VATAQVEAWVSTLKGSIPEVARGIDVSLADAALGRMMVHRRRAVVASVIADFFAQIGSRYAPYLEGHASAAPLDAASERVIAAKAGELAASFCGAAPPLAFERALLAESCGQFGEALADLKKVLAVYPGFVAGAIAAARMALVVGDPEEAIRLLASVEGETTHTREGAALLAAAARAVGLHQSASWYDLEALVCRGGYDSHGNDCTPFDLSGKIADDLRMPQVLYLAGQVDSSVICNAGGIYYNVKPSVGHLLMVLNRARRLSTMRSLAPTAAGQRRSTLAEIFEAAAARLRLSMGGRFPNASALLRTYSVLLRTYSVSAWTALWRILAAVFGLAARIDLALVVFLYRLYRRLPLPVRARANEIAQALTAWLRPLIRDVIAPHFGPRGSWRLFSRIHDSYGFGRLAEARYQSGLARIFGLGPYANRSETMPLAGDFLLERLSVSARAPRDEVALEMPPPGKLAPRAEDALRRLMNQIDTARSAQRL